MVYSTAGENPEDPSADVLRRKASMMFKSWRSAMFVNHAPINMLQFCVDRYENGSADEKAAVSQVTRRGFGFTNSNLSESEHWKQWDNDFCDVFQNCFDLIATSSRFLPLGLASAFDVLSPMSENMRRYKIDATPENQRTRYLVNVITFRLPSRTVIKPSYTTFIGSNRESIERNLERILERRLCQPRDIRELIEVHPVLTGGTL